MARMLVVDDEAPLREMITQMLQRDGHQVVTATDGNAALGILSKDKDGFDLVMLDILMPNKDGIETTMEIKRRFPGAKVLAMSGGRRSISANFNLSSAELMGADAILPKPFDWQALRTALQGLLG